MAARPREPNPEAIAWCVEQAEGLLGGNADRILGVLSGPPRVLSGAAMLLGAISLVTALAVSILGGLFRPLIMDISAREIANYTTEPFTHEPDLWRIHLRTIRGLLEAIDTTAMARDRAAATLRWAGLLFLVGLVSVGLALVILIAEVTV
jgi:hypothetical protein